MTDVAGSESVRLEQVQVGDVLPELAVELSTSLIVAGALASRDYTRVHHDRSAAEAASSTECAMTSRR